MEKHWIFDRGRVIDLEKILGGDDDTDSEEKTLAYPHFIMIILHLLAKSG